MEFEKFISIYLETTSQEDTVTLNQLYDGEYPDSDELLWNFVGTDEFDTPMFIETISPAQIFELFKKQYGVNTMGELNKLLSKEQKAIVKSFMVRSNLSEEIIVICNGIVVDGNHRALAALFEKVPIKYVNLESL